MDCSDVQEYILAIYYVVYLVDRNQGAVWLCRVIGTSQLRFEDLKATMTYHEEVPPQVQQRRVPHLSKGSRRGAGDHTLHQPLSLPDIVCCTISAQCAHVME